VFLAKAGCPTKMVRCFNRWTAAQDGLTGYRAAVVRRRP
jgi:hypothetical protein